MSYCRWSSDNFNCDIYAYESCYGGFEIHVARARFKGEIPKVNYDLLSDKSTHEEFIKQRTTQSQYLENCGTEEIKLKYAGENLKADTLEEFKKMMLELKELGYNIPAYTFKRIEEEIKEQRD